MQHVVVIGGGDAFDTYDAYLAALRERTFDLERLRAKGWKSSLSSALGEEFDVLSLRMPCPDNAKYLEWKIVFEKFLLLLSEPAVFVGHSLGGIFLAKYFSEEHSFEKVKVLFLVAAPFEDANGYSLVDFSITDDLRGLKSSGIPVHLYQSEDDTIVPYSNFKRYAEALPSAVRHSFTDRWHFVQEEFPELVEDIRNPDKKQR